MATRLPASADTPSRGLSRIPSPAPPSARQRRPTCATMLAHQSRKSALWRAGKARDSSRGCGLYGDMGRGTGSPYAINSATVSATICLIPARASPWGGANQLRLGNSAHRPTYSLSKDDQVTLYHYWSIDIIVLSGSSPAAVRKAHLLIFWSQQFFIGLTSPTFPATLTYVLAVHLAQRLDNRCRLHVVRLQFVTVSYARRIVSPAPRDRRLTLI